MRSGAAANRRVREEQRKLQADKDDKKNKKTKGSKPTKAKSNAGSTPSKESAKRTVRTCPRKNLSPLERSGCCGQAQPRPVAANPTKHGTKTRLAMRMRHVA
jgi:hypothetical protein